MAISRLLAVAVLVAFGAPTLASSQGLGDAAAREKKRRASPAKPTGKTYTEDDLASLPPTANEDDADSDTSSPDVTGVTREARPLFVEERRDTGRTRADEEEAWRTRVARAQARIDEAQQAYEKVAALTLVPGYELVDDKGRPIVRSVEELQALTSRAKARVDEARKALDDLLEQARRAGVPPGWLR